MREQILKFAGSHGQRARHLDSWHWPTIQQVFIFLPKSLQATGATIRLSLNYNLGRFANLLGPEKICDVSRQNCHGRCAHPFFWSKRSKSMIFITYASASHSNYWCVLSQFVVFNDGHPLFFASHLVFSAAVRTSIFYYHDDGKRVRCEWTTNGSISLWMFTQVHKRTMCMQCVVVKTFFWLVGSIFSGFIRSGPAAAATAR